MESWYTGEDSQQVLSEYSSTSTEWRHSTSTRWILKCKYWVNTQVQVQVLSEDSSTSTQWILKYKYSVNTQVQVLSEYSSTST